MRCLQQIVHIEYGKSRRIRPLSITTGTPKDALAYCQKHYPDNKVVGEVERCKGDITANVATEDWGECSEVNIRYICNRCGSVPTPPGLPRELEDLNTTLNNLLEKIK